MEKVLKEKYIIDDVEFVKGEIERVARSEVDYKEMYEFIEEELNTIFFLDANLKHVTEDNAMYVWLDSGYRAAKDESIFISLLKHGDYYNGYFVGTATYLANGVCNKNPRNSACIKNNVRKFNMKYPEIINKRKVKGLVHIEKEECPQTRFVLEKEENRNGDYNPVDKLAEELFNNIKYPNWNSVDGLKRYLKIIGHRIDTLVLQGKTEYYLHNKIGAVINTGLIDKYGEDYILYYKIHRTRDGEMVYKAEEIVYSKDFYETNRFTCDRIPKPICFFDESNKVFQPTLEDFNITSRNLEHIVNERNERFPKDWQDISESKKAEAIRYSLKNGIKIQQRDISFAKAIYSTECKCVSWTLPLYLNRDYPMEPELVLVIRKQGNYYEVKTILPYDDELKDRMTAMSLYRNIW